MITVRWESSMLPCLVASVRSTGGAVTKGVIPSTNEDACGGLRLAMLIQGPGVRMKKNVAAAGDSSPP
jgi:hypothetical protein